MSAPTPVPGQPRSRREDRSGFAVVLYALFGIGAVAIVGAAVAVYLLVQSDEGQRIVAAAQIAVEWAAVAATAPGTAELRDAGCEVAMANTSGDAIEALLPLVLEGGDDRDKLLGDLEQEVGSDLSELTIVLCTLPQLSNATPECEDFARAYGAALEFPPDEFALFVARQGAEEPHCSGLYTPEGVLRKPFPAVDTATEKSF